ncbi:MAG: hypothetical protein ACUVSK_11875 [Desulfotomaculales bacterium]
MERKKYPTLAEILAQIPPEERRRQDEKSREAAKRVNGWIKSYRRKLRFKVAIREFAEMFVPLAIALLAGYLVWRWA